MYCTYGRQNTQPPKLAKNSSSMMPSVWFCGMPGEYHAAGGDRLLDLVTTIKEDSDDKMLQININVDVMVKGAALFDITKPKKIFPSSS